MKEYILINSDSTIDTYEGGTIPSIYKEGQVVVEITNWENKCQIINELFNNKIITLNDNNNFITSDRPVDIVQAKVEFKKTRKPVITAWNSYLANVGVGYEEISTREVYQEWLDFPEDESNFLDGREYPIIDNNLIYYSNGEL